MKLCKYCGSECNLNDAFCTACGANEFKYRCDNCGNVFDKGLYCPMCGVKADQKKKVCPKCGKEYYSAACPDCGYMPGKEQPAYTSVPNASKGAYDSPYNYQGGGAAVQTVKRKKHTGLWVLGWIFCFPIPLTIIICRSKKLPLWLKILLVAALWLFILIAGSTDSEAAELATAGALLIA